LKAKIIISRYKKEKSWTDEFDVDVKEGTTVLDLLKILKDEFDGSLSFRHSCRSGICGSCAVQINGTGKLACKTQALPEIKKFGSLRIEPLKGHLRRSSLSMRQLDASYVEFVHSIARPILLIENLRGPQPWPTPSK
jgi:succinate dehydrogenase/fumarate reductase iron-sulfur protein